jgi:hypothetical protein
MFDKADTTNKFPFAITYIFGPVQSVRNASELGLGLHPLPATDRVTITGSDLVRGIDLYSSTGAILRTYAVNPGSTMQVDVRDVPSGSYHLLFTCEGGTVVQAPFVIAR